MFEKKNAAVILIFDERIFSIYSYFLCTSGQNCPYYDVQHNSINYNLNQPCKEHKKPCPPVYKSSSVYLCKFLVLINHCNTITKLPVVNMMSNQVIRTRIHAIYLALLLNFYVVLIIIIFIYLQ